MRTLWFVCILAVVSVVACGGNHEAVKDIEVVADTDAVILDEEPLTDTGGTDADIKPATEGPSGAQQWVGALPTGQTKCYDNEGEIPCPEPGEPFFGQDPQFNQWKARSLTPGSGATAGTVADDVTHLLWQAAYRSGLPWVDAVSYCGGLTLAGKKWRLPTPHELKSLINYGKLDGDAPARPATDFPVDMSKELGPCYTDGTCDPGQECVSGKCYGSTPVDWFWASGRTHDASTAWVVYFYDGYLEYTARDNLYSVRCVTSN